MAGKAALGLIGLGVVGHALRSRRFRERVIVGAIVLGALRGLGQENRASAFERLTLMFQQEVADRICAEPGSGAYGRLSVLAQCTCRPDGRSCSSLCPGRGCNRPFHLRTTDLWLGYAGRRRISMRKR